MAIPEATAIAASERIADVFSGGPAFLHATVNERRSSQGLYTFTQRPSLATIRIIHDPVRIEEYLRQRGIHPRAIEPLTHLSDAVRILGKHSRVQWVPTDGHPAHSLLADIEVEVDHLDSLYDDAEWDYIASLQHAAWFVFVCAVEGYDGYIPFAHYERRSRAP